MDDPGLTQESRILVNTLALPYLHVLRVFELTPPSTLFSVVLSLSHSKDSETKNPRRVCDQCNTAVSGIQDQLALQYSNAMRENTVPDDTNRYLNSPIRFTMGEFAVIVVVAVVVALLLALFYLARAIHEATRFAPFTPALTKIGIVRPHVPFYSFPFPSPFFLSHQPLSLFCFFCVDPFHPP